MAAKKKKTSNTVKNEQKTGPDAKLQLPAKKSSPILFLLKDILLAIVVLGSLYVFIQGHFHTDDKVEEYQKNIRKILASDQVSQEQKDKYRKEEAGNVDRLRLLWGYNFAYNKLIKQNYEIISQNPDMSMETKMYSKLGALGYILHNLKNNTPDTAKIILPFTDEMMDTRTCSFDFNNQTNKVVPKNMARKYFNWFTYPRELILLTEDDKDRLTEATHVIIFDKKGAEYAQVQPGQQLSNFGVYPTKKQ